MPDASRRPPGRSSRASGTASVMRSDAMRFARTTSYAGSPLGSEPNRAWIRRPSRFRRALATVASTAIGSVSTPRTVAAPRRAAAIARMPDPQPTSSTRAPSRLPRSVASSSADRHSLVVGCSPVPNAIPGSRARTMSSGAARWRRQVGRITMRRPTRSTGKCAFQASAQSASSTSRVRSLPIGRSPKACRWDRAASASRAAACADAASRAGT